MYLQPVRDKSLDPTTCAWKSSYTLRLVPWCLLSCCHLWMACIVLYCIVLLYWCHFTKPTRWRTKIKETSKGSEVIKDSKPHWIQYFWKNIGYPKHMFLLLFSKLFPKINEFLVKPECLHPEMSTEGSVSSFSLSPIIGISPSHSLICSRMLRSKRQLNTMLC